MIYIFTLIVILHAFIHILGFIKGFELKEINQLTLPISKKAGIIWLITSLLFLTFMACYLLNFRYTWTIGFLAVALSQILIVLYWHDAKFGSIPNFIILCVSIVLFGQFNFEAMIQKELSALLHRDFSSDNRVLQEKDINTLPFPVKQWLKTSGSVGKPFIKVGKVIQKAEMKTEPDQENWIHAVATQYTIIDKPTFIWSVIARVNSLVYFHGRDKYENGSGEMLIKLNSLITIVKERGEKLDEATLQRFLGEMIWFPSLAVNPYIRWEAIDDTTAKATISYHNTTASGTFYFNPDGECVRFSTYRFKGNEPEAKRYEWVVNVEDYALYGGIKVPSKMSATWKLEHQDWTWLKVRITDIKYNTEALPQLHSN